MRRMIDIVREAKKVEEKAEKDYKKLLKKLNKPEYADLRGLVLRLAIDTAFHKRLMEALEKAHNDAIKLVEEYAVEKPDEDFALIPGVPTMVMPLGFGPIGARIPPEEIIEEYLKDFPTEVVLPGTDEKLIEILRKYAEEEEQMKELYEELSKRAFHPVVRELVREIKRNEEQHESLVKGLVEKYSKD
ncbi:ferritin family protein [Thermococcus sp.]|uniref:ferritin family protein n=1 Tax=Thermococcus sp. TaxID=35749 RepID=UPI0026349F05|nr:ferritin family protein [Thermococcus sp.]